MTKDKALKLALEALETYKGFIDDAHIVEGQWHWIDGLDNVQTAIKEALAQPDAFADASKVMPQPEQANAFDRAMFDADEDLQMLMDRDMGDN